MAVSSLAYAKMRKALLDMVCAIPVGEVVEIGAIAASLNIPARHAAFILAGISDEERELLPWHRVVPRQGRFERKRMSSERTQRQLAMLCREGWNIDAMGRLNLSADRMWQPTDAHRSTQWAELED